MSKLSLSVTTLFLASFLTAPALAVTITPTSSAVDLVNAILGPGVNLVGVPTLIGEANQQGTFTDGTGEVGFADGIVLSSGNVNQIPGPNTNGPESVGGLGLSDDVSTSLGTAGDSDLNTLSGGTTFDANVLTFDFQFGDGSTGGDLFFSYVFGSEEYINWIDTSFNDVFGFFLDGTNIGLVGGVPVTINNVNNSMNSAFYINNVTNTDGLPVAGLNIRFDGLTTVLTAQALGLGAGTHTISLKIADTADGILDAGVFIKGGSFSTEPPVSGVPEPGTITLLGLGVVGLLMGRRRRSNK